MADGGGTNEPGAECYIEERSFDCVAGRFAPFGRRFATSLRINRADGKTGALRPSALGAVVMPTLSGSKRLCAKLQRRTRRSPAIAFPHQI